ncbi:hypothetical protein [Agromyces badenianii]|uniref:hypothetical protein n=1 Tax=Agromyces badenianii TaxID=2080742 RepID=UPI000D58EAF7|nr:hypothetical protein [Agromyces badenianii]PWC05589.1 hypothetical protein DCE94_04835 [Agromyces badenianii]
MSSLKKRSLYSLVGAAAVGVLLLSTALPANAAEEGVSAATITEEQLTGLYEAASGDAGSVTFDAEKALELGNDPQLVEEFSVGVEAGGGTVLGGTHDEVSVEALREYTAAAAAACNGRNGGSTMWYGWQLRIDSCKSSILIASVGGGASVAVIAGLLTSWTGIGGISAGAIAAVLGLGTAFLSICAAPGNGMGLNLAYTGTPWCWTQ